MRKDLEQLVDTLNVHLKNTLDLSSPKAKVEFHPPEAFAENRSYYSPKSSTVHIPKNVSIPTFIHEYYGHAFFDNYSIIGKELASLEKKIAPFESRYDIPKEAMILIKPTKGKSRLEKGQDNNEYILYCDPADKEVKGYIHNKGNYKQAFVQFRPLQEGFACWMECFLLKALRKENIWEKREEYLKETSYYKSFVDFANDVNRMGVLTVFYKLGFPKSSREDLIILYAKENLKDFTDLKILLQYGSGQRDIDLMAVYDDQIRIKNKLIYDGNIDINVMNEKTFFERLNKFDIELIEPLLSGKILIGNKEYFETLKKSVKEAKPNEISIDYAKRCALESSIRAEFYLDQHRYKTLRSKIWTADRINLKEIVMGDSDLEVPDTDLTRALNSLRYCLSHMTASEIYEQGRIVRLNEILAKNRLLKELDAYFKIIQNGLAVPTRKETTIFFRKVKQRIKNQLFHNASKNLTP